MKVIFFFILFFLIFLKIQPKEFNDIDEVLDHIERVSYSYFWEEVDGETGLIQDKMSQKGVFSIASIGFGLAVLPIGIERKWKSFEQVENRVFSILKTLNGPQCLKKYGFLFHYLDGDGSPSSSGYEVMVSSIDSVLLFTGAIVVQEYFKYSSSRIVEEVKKLISNVDYRSFSNFKIQDGVVEMGWRPNDLQNKTGDGTFIDLKWDYYTDELLLINLLGIAQNSKDKTKGIPPKFWYNWERNVGKYNNTGDSFVYTKPGAAFTYQFAHLFIDFEKLGKDQPLKYKKNVVPVDWYQNSITATKIAQQYAIDRHDQYPTFNEKAFGQTACVIAEGYCVGGFIPRGETGESNCNGAISPYGSISSLFLTPEICLPSLLYYYNLKDSEGNKIVWKEKNHGFQDTFNLETKYVPNEVLGIDQGPIILSIENYRTKMIQDLFMQSKSIQFALHEIGFEEIH